MNKQRKQNKLKEFMLFFKNNQNITFFVKLIKLTAELAVIVGVIIALWQGIAANNRVDLNTELANRPFVGIEKVVWLADKVWFESYFKAKNYGDKPAEEFKFRNFHAIVFSIDLDKIRQKIKEGVTKDTEQYFEEYLLDYKNKLYLELLQILSDYFRSSPNARKSDLQNFLSSLSNAETYLRKIPNLSYKGNLLFGIIEINNDMEDYYNKQYFLKFPNQTDWHGLREQMGSAAGVLESNNLLVVYWAIKYKGFKKNKEYSTFYLGYDCKEKQVSQAPPYKLQEFQSWMSESN